MLSPTKVQRVMAVSIALVSKKFFVTFTSLLHEVMILKESSPHLVTNLLGTEGYEEKIADTSAIDQVRSLRRFFSVCFRKFSYWIKEGVILLAFCLFSRQPDIF